MGNTRSAALWPRTAGQTSATKTCTKKCKADTQSTAFFFAAVQIDAYISLRLGFALRGTPCAQLLFITVCPSAIHLRAYRIILTASHPPTHSESAQTRRLLDFSRFRFPQMKYFLLACLAVAVAPIAGAPQRRATACTDYDEGSTCKLVREVECVPCMFGHAALRAHADARCSRGTICVGSGAEWRRGPPARPFCHILDGLGTPSTLSLSLYRFLLARLLLVKERRALFFV